MASPFRDRSVILASFAVGCGVTAFVSWLLRKKTSDDSTLNNSSNSTSSRLPDHIRDEQLSRHTLYFGDEGMHKLKSARVCVVGVGGVGSHCAHMLARSGLGHLRLIDFDQVTVSSLNRHACAVLADVGTPKTECLEKFLRQICPDEQHLKIEYITEMYTAETGERLLYIDGEQQKWDTVIDCIDDVPTKAALLAYCITHKIRVVSCMGAGGKADPTRLHVSDMRSAARDPLATKIRQTLKQHMINEPDYYLDDMDQLTILFSSETTVVKLADFTDEQKEQGVHQFGAVDGMRIRVVPVLGTMPAIMGQALASICLTSIAGGSKKLQPVTCERVGRSTRHKLHQRLGQREQSIAKRVRAEAAVAATAGGAVTVETTSSVDGDGELITVNGKTTWIGPLQIDVQDDMEYLMEIWRNRCAVTGARLGTVLHVVRWDESRPSSCDNLVIVSANVLPNYDVSIALFKANLDPVVRQSIERRLASMRISLAITNI